MYDLVIRNATIVDGARTPRYAGDIAVANGLIAAIGRDLPRGDSEIDASGKIAAPGFIDAHTHDDRALLEGDMAMKLSQGVTTVVAGNCGVSLAPSPRGMSKPVIPPLDLMDVEGDWYRRFPKFADYVGALQATPPATNCALLVGHTALRVQTMDDLERPATEPERAEMRKLAEEALASGAIGISTGLYYEPARNATTEEVIDVCRPLQQRKGVYCTHLRDEGDQVTEALEEAFRIGRELGVRVVVSHHKVVGRANHGRSCETLPLIESRMREQPISLDCYPYTASSTILSASRAASASKVLVTWSKPHPEYAGRELSEIAAEMGLTPEQAADKLVPAGAIYFAMDEEDVRRILAFEHTMVGSDGLPGGHPHPRLWGTFPRVLGHYARDLGVFTLETAVYKMTGLTARAFGFRDRGVLKAGAAADITIFDAASIRDAATFEQPTRPAAGMDTVIVNGRVAWRGGAPKGAPNGRVLKGN